MNDTDPGPGELPRAVFLGYCAKLTWTVPEGSWAENPANGYRPPAEVCSASGCLAGHPPGWFDDPFEPPPLNRAGCTESAAAARERVPGPDRPAYRVFAYRAIPAVFGRADPTPVVLAAEALFGDYGYLEELPPGHDLSGFDQLGFDVVQYSDAINWGCSPLSCNYQYQHHAVNRYCLIDAAGGAAEAARAFGRTEPEPGPYIIVQVFRERGAGHATAE